MFSDFFDSGAPHPPRSPTRGHVARMSRAVSGLPRSYTLHGSAKRHSRQDWPKGRLEVPAPNRLGGMGLTTHPSKGKDWAKEACWRGTVLRLSSPQPPGAQLPPARVAPHGQQGAHTVGWGTPSFAAPGVRGGGQKERGRREGRRQDDTPKEDVARGPQRGEAHVGHPWVYLYTPDPLGVTL